MSFSQRALPLLLLLGTLGACNTFKRVPPGEALYDGSTIKLEGEGKKAAKALKTELGPLLRPEKNAKILGWRWRLALYNLSDSSEKKRGLRRFLARKYGEAPVLASEVNLEKNHDVLVNRLQNRGYFQATGTFDTVVKSRLMKASYSINTGPQYRIRAVAYEVDSTVALGRVINRMVSGRGRRGSGGQKRPGGGEGGAGTSLLKPGDPYNLDLIKAEGDRLDARLKERGFYYFGSSYFITEADTTVGDRQVDLFVRLEERTPEKAKQIYRIRDVVIYPDFDLTRPEDTLLGKSAATLFDSVYIIDPQQKFKPSLFTRNLTFHPGERYNRRDHNLSLSRLVTLGTFKFVKATFREVDSFESGTKTDTTGHYLDAYYYATPQPMKRFSAEITALTRSNNATGTQLAGAWRHRNAFRAAELFTVSAFFGAENQVAGQQNIATLRYGAEAALTLPRLVSPFKHRPSTEFVPRTRIGIGYEFFNRTNQYTLTSATATYGYQWKRRLVSDHALTLVNLAAVDSSNISEEFQRRLLFDITLRRSLARQFIIGTIYNYNYTSQARPNRRQSNWYFNGNVDGSGNLLGLVTGTSFGDKEPLEIFGTPFSQYIRGEVEGRHYLRLGGTDGPPDNYVLASRLLLGTAYAYGNTEVVPFVKQFFAGGVNSIRAFRARSLGPGTYYAGNAQNAVVDTANNGNTRFFLPDQPGDVRLELNTELRFTIVAVLKGAVFVDAGNIWTVREDTARPGAKLTSQALSQLAVGTGAGVRLDIGFLVARLDLAFPIRKPYLPGGPAWTFGDLNFGDAAWRKENLILNLAIGYPF